MFLTLEKRKNNRVRFIDKLGRLSYETIFAAKNLQNLACKKSNRDFLHKNAPLHIGQIGGFFQNFYGATWNGKRSRNYKILVVPITHFEEFLRQLSNKVVEGLGTIH